MLTKVTPERWVNFRALFSMQVKGRTGTNAGKQQIVVIEEWSSFS